MSYLSLLPAFERLPYRVVMVCTGNICRSAMAQIVLAQRLRELGVSEVEVSSAGVSNEEQATRLITALPDYCVSRAIRVVTSARTGPLRLLTASCVTLICC